MGITGTAFITLGIICISMPVATVVALAWILGIIAIIGGTATLLNWGSLRHYFVQSGSIFFSGLLQIIMGILFLKHDIAVAAILPIIFALFLIFEGINLAIRSFDYRYVRFKYWWINLLLGIIAALLGFLSLTVRGFGGPTLSAFIGIGFMIIGIVYMVALCTINRFEMRLRDDMWLDE